MLSWHFLEWRSPRARLHAGAAGQSGSRDRTEDECNASGDLSVVELA